MCVDVYICVFFSISIDAYKLKGHICLVQERRIDFNYLGSYYQIVLDFKVI